MLGAFGYGLFLKGSPKRTLTAQSRATESGQDDVLLNLEREAKQSSGKFWFGTEEERSSTPPG